MKVLLALILSFGLMTEPCAANEIGWKLDQKHAEFGNVTILLGQNNLKIDNTTFKYQIVANAPNWDVIMYRSSEKKQCRMKYSYFTTVRVFKFLTLERNLEKPELLKQKSEAQGELKFTCYGFKEGTRELLCVSDNIKTSRPAINIIEAYYNTKVSPGVPVRVVYEFRQDKQKAAPNASWFSGGLNGGFEGLTTFLQTLSAKKVSLRASDFNYPPDDYKHVKTASELMISTNQAASLNSVMDDLGLDGSKLGKGKK